MSPTFRKGAIVAALALLAFFAGAASLFVSHKNPLQSLIPTPAQVFHKDKLLVLVVGLDYDYDDKDDETSKSSRSDIIKAIDLDFKTNKIYVLSVPRDMDAILPDGQEAKINEAQSEGGIKESQAVVAKWLGIPPFDRYVVLRIDTMKDLINAIGGVDVDVKNSDALKGQGPNGPIDYDDSWGHLHVHLRPGLQHLNGDEAVGYARFRHDWCSDPCRIMRQDQVIRAIVARLKGDKLNTLAHSAALIGVVRRDIETDLSYGEEISLANAFSSLSPDDVKTAQVPYVADKEIPVYGDVIVPDTAARAQLVRSMLLDPPRPAPPHAQEAAAAIKPAQMRVDVENGTAQAGLAKQVADLLESKGFDVVNVGNASRIDVVTTEVHAAASPAALAVRDALGPGAGNAAILTDGSRDVRLVIGQDLASAMGAQPAPR